MKVRYTAIFACLCSVFPITSAWADWASVSTNKPAWLVNDASGKMVGADASNIYVSNDSGKTWPAVVGPAIGPNTSLGVVNSQVWVGSTSQGAAYSNDAGATWTKSSTGMVHPLTKVVNYPLRTVIGLGNVIVAGPFVSKDGGVSWKATTTGLPDNSSTCILGSCQKYPIITGAATNSAFLVGTETGVYRSSDGENWSSSGLSANQVAILAAKGATVYASVTSGATGLYKSTDGGSNWSKVANIAFAPTAIAIHPTKDNVAFVGDSSGKVYVSKDGGGAWENIADANISGAVAALAVPSGLPDSLIAATANGTFQYTATVTPTQPPFSIPEITRAPLNTTIVSEVISVTGLFKPELISISGGKYSINGRPFTSDPGIVVNGARIRVQLQSSASFDTAASATLTIGQQSAAFKVTTLKQVLVTNVNQVLQNTHPNVSLVNGVLQVTGTPTTPLQLSGTATNNAVVQLPQNTPVQVQSGTQTLTYTDVTGSSQLAVQPITTSQTGLQVSSGTFNVQSSGSGVVPVGSSGTGTVSTLTTQNGCQTSMTIGRTGSQTSAFVETCKVTYGSGGTSGGSGFAASGVDVYGGETAELSDTGSLQMVRIGSLNGDKSLPGDPASLTTGLTVDPDTKVPNLAGNLQRLNNAASLLDVIQNALNTQFGVTTGKATYDAASGVVTYVVNGKTYRFIPYGSPLISTGSGGNGFKAASAASSASGSFSLASQGIQITLAGTFGYFNDLNTSLKAFSSAATVRLRSSGAFQISLLGTEYICAPGTASSGGGATPVQTPGFQINNNGLITFTDSYGALQVLYPAFADSNVANSTTKAVDATGSFVDNGDGTSTMTIFGQSFKLKPEYSLSAVPSTHSSESWWVDGTKVYLRYNDEGKAQGMTVN